MTFSSIRTRIITNFIAVVLLTSVLFTGMVFIFSYYVEDAFFQQILNEEHALLQQTKISGKTYTPSKDYVQLFLSQEQLPESIRDVLRDEPERSEFSGEQGRHYHLKHTDWGILVAEVSDHLIVRKITGGIFTTLFVVMGLTTLIVVVLAFALAKRLLKPVDKLMSVLSNIKGDTMPAGFSEQFAHDEMGHFARELERTMNRIQAFITREQHFTRDVSHELRTPVSICLGATTLLKESDLTEDQRVLVDRIETAQHHMQRCIEGLLALAREQEMKSESVALLPLVESAIIEHHQLIEHKDIEIDLTLTPQDKVLSHPQACRIIISNLIRNAFEHTDEGQVTITFTKDTLAIRNTSDPISASALPTMFEPGVRGEASTGFGIGLSLVKRLCESLKHKIDLISDGDGTSVRVAFGRE